MATHHKYHTRCPPKVNAQVNIVQLHNPTLVIRWSIKSRQLAHFFLASCPLSCLSKMRFSSIQRGFPPSYNGRHVKGKIRWLKWRRTFRRQLVVAIIRNDYFSRPRPRLLTRSPFPSWMIFSLSYTRVCQDGWESRIYRRDFNQQRYH